ncbi:MAG: hypothetical protein V1886_02420 [archaeon]
MKNPWCVYGVMRDRVGKVVRESSPKSVYILYSDGQMYSAELWDSAYVKRFRTIIQAIKHNVEHSDIGRHRILERALSDFPSQKSKIEKLILLWNIRD